MAITEWNIDGKSEYQIKTIIKQMLIYSSAAKIKGNNDRQIAQAIITGFTGQLQGWWDFYLSKEAKNKILNSSIVELNGREESDAVNTLIYTILSNFIGANELQLDRSQEQLMNLRCPTLSEFKWYQSYCNWRNSSEINKSYSSITIFFYSVRKKVVIPRRNP